MTKTKLKTRKRLLSRNKSKQHTRIGSYKVFGGGENQLDNLTSQAQTHVNNLKNTVQQTINSDTLKSHAANLKSHAENIQKQVPKLRNLFKNMNSGLVEKIKDVTKGVSIKSIEALGKFTDVDLFDKADINSKLQKIVVVITDPATKENFKKILKEYVDYGFILLEASEPYAKPMLDKGSIIVTDAISKMSESATKILLNSLTEIPGFGVLVGTARSLDSAGTAFLSVINASAQVISLSSDSMSGISKNFQKLMNDKTQIHNRILQSTSAFNSTQPTVLKTANPIIGPLLATK